MGSRRARRQACNHNTNRKNAKNVTPGVRVPVEKVGHKRCQASSIIFIPQRPFKGGRAKTHFIHSHHSIIVSCVKSPSPSLSCHHPAFFSNAFAATQHAKPHHDDDDDDDVIRAVSACLKHDAGALHTHGADNTHPCTHTKQCVQTNQKNNAKPRRPNTTPRRSETQ